MSARGRRLLFGLFITVTSTVMLVAAQQAPAPAPGPFTAAQADSGRQLYLANCAACHGEALAGPPALKGEAFMANWATQTTNALYDKVRTTMPPEAPGSLGADNYVSVVAFILRENGQTPGNTPLNAGVAVPIQGAGAGGAGAGQGAAGRGQGAGGGQQAAGGQGRAGGAGGQGGGGAGGGRGQPAAPRLGLTVEGTVKNFTPITDDMLRNPPRG